MNFAGKPLAWRYDHDSTANFGSLFNCVCNGIGCFLLVALSCTKVGDHDSLHPEKSGIVMVGISKGISICIVYSPTCADLIVHENMAMTMLIRIVICFSFIDLFF
jgi:hypothetical protein